jgi:hypothetical protein
MILALAETRYHHLRGQQDAEQSRRQETPVKFRSKPVPFELSRSNGDCHAQIACSSDGVARHCFRVPVDSQPRRRGGIGQRTLEIFQPRCLGASGPNRPARALPDHGIFFVVGEKPKTLAPAIGRLARRAAACSGVGSASRASGDVRRPRVAASSSWSPIPASSTGRRARAR